MSKSMHSMTTHGSSDVLRPLLPPAKVDRLAAAFSRFFAIQASSGIVLMACTAIALYLANSQWADAYDAFWHMRCRVAFGSFVFEKDLPARAV